MRPLLAGEEQLLVENYFAAAGSLPAAYWNGIYRSGSANPFKYLSGQLVSDVVGNANPYAHWWAAGPPPAPPTRPTHCCPVQHATGIVLPLIPRGLCPQDLDVQCRQGDR
jgi:hypothetical protein